MAEHPEIIYEDNHLVAVNKTNHDLVQKDHTGDEALDDRLKHYLKEKYHKPGNVYLGIAHRLDRPVSGAVIFTRTSKALSRMNSLFRNGEVRKIYWAIVKNSPPKEKDTLIDFLLKNQKQNKSYCLNGDKEGAKRAELDYRLLARSEQYHLLEIVLKTGRHHQIRVQLANMGCPIRGDLKYGYPRSNPDGGISLHARQIGFLHPVTQEETVIVARPPLHEKLWEFFLYELNFEK